MNPPSQNDVNGMADLLRAMNNGENLFDASEDIPPAPRANMPAYFRAGDIDPETGLVIEGDPFAYDDIPAPTIDPARAPRVPVSTEENSAMANILRAFVESGGENLAKIDGAIDQASSILMEDAEAMPILKRSMQTERTSTGVRIGGWQIIAENDKKRFHVVSVHSGQQIAKNLYLYEAAEALVNHLNDGSMINNIKVQNILQLEMDYAKHIEDAIQHRHACSRALDRGDDARLEVAKIRFNEAKTKALAARHKLLEHLGSK